MVGKSEASVRPIKFDNIDQDTSIQNDAHLLDGSVECQEYFAPLQPLDDDNDLDEIINVLSCRDDDTNNEIRDGEHRVFITTGKTPTSHEVVLNVFGTNGTSGPIILVCLR